MFWTNLAIDILLVFFVIDCALMCLVIMMQRSKQEGLGAAFGGGFTESMWGAQTSQVLVKATVVLAAAFFLISISLARLYSHQASLKDEAKSSVQQQLLAPVVPATPAPAPAAPATNAAVTAPAIPAASTTNATPAPAQPAAK